MHDLKDASTGATHLECLNIRIDQKIIMKHHERVQIHHPQKIQILGKHHLRVECLKLI